MDLSIRAATAKDETVTVALWRLCGLTVSHNEPAQDFCFALNKENSDILVAADGNSIAASIMVGHDGHRGWIYYLAVDPAQRRKRLGRKMVEAAEQWLRQRKVPKIMLMVRETNPSVVAFYQHLGYETAPRVVMQKWLKD